MTGVESSSLATARARVDALGAAIARAEGSPPRLVETAISWVLLGRELAHKIKKPVRLPFLDFTSLAERQRLCAEELRINRRFAPDLYLDVVQICAGPEGPSFGAAGPLLDVAVRMRRFPDGALWSERIAAGTLAAADIDAFARPAGRDPRRRSHSTRRHAVRIGRGACARRAPLDRGDRGVAARSWRPRRRVARAARVA
jgi:aminoglycoside phosphotransferase family enzyme